MDERLDELQAPIEEWASTNPWDAGPPHFT